MLLPAAIRWLGTLESVKAAGIAKPRRGDRRRSSTSSSSAIFALEAANRDHPEDDSDIGAAKYVQTTVFDAMAAVREVADRLERIVPDDLWPLPKYSEILFIK